MKLIAINQAEAVRLGKPPETLLSKTCDETIWAEATECITKIVHQTFRTGEEKNWESQINIAHRGPFTDRDVRTYPIFEPPDRVVQVIIFAQDVSEKRQLQASLFRSANLAAVGQLASGIAHQINNPLTVIIANSQIMQMDTDTRSPDYPVIQHIVDAGTQIRAIVQNLLDFSSQDSYDWGETDLLETIEDALSLVGQSLARKEISIIKHFTPIPSIIGSTSRLKLLWMSLLLNAEDAITETKHPGTIEIWVEALDTKFIQIKIVDNGIGIPSSLHDRLFHPFFSTKSTPEHVGLGLYTCRAIISAHQGQIRIDANQDLPGTTVTVNLPA
jgi:two-component system NtrC family sensor kinase